MEKELTKTKKYIFIGKNQKSYEFVSTEEQRDAVIRALMYQDGLTYPDDAIGVVVE